MYEFVQRMYKCRIIITGRGCYSSETNKNLFVVVWVWFCVWMSFILFPFPIRVIGFVFGKERGEGGGVVIMFMTMWEFV